MTFSTHLVEAWAGDAREQREAAKVSLTAMAGVQNLRALSTAWMSTFGVFAVTPALDAE